MIYFDHSATTPLDSAVLEVMTPYFNEHFGNASSVHSFGQRAALATDQSRRAIANFFNASPDSVIFTSGATESNNLAIFGLIKGLARPSFKPHIITTVIEHEAVLAPCRALADLGLADITYLPVNAQGLVDLDQLSTAIQDNTVLVSVVYVDSELGHVQPIKAIGRLIFKVNEARQQAWQSLRTSERHTPPLKLYFHTDATQAVNFFNIDMVEFKLDLLSFSAHKLYGPKGVGALIARPSLPLKPLIYGGRQERNLRSGTLNVPGIVGLAAALQLITDQGASRTAHIRSLRDNFLSWATDHLTDFQINTITDHSSPAHAHLSFSGLSGEALLMALDMQAGIAVSTGSACASATGKPSPALLALGRSEDQARSSLRLTFGKDNTLEELDTLKQVLPAILDKFRS